MRNVPKAVLVLSLLTLPAIAFAQSPLSFDLSLAPNSSGALEGSASLVLRWAGFAQTGLLFSADSFMEEYDEAGGGSTVVMRSATTLDLELFRLDEDALSLAFPGGSVSASVAAIANGAVIDEDRYGHSPAYVWFQGQRTMWVKPLLGADLSARLGPLSLAGYYRTSWPFELEEYVEGSALYSPAVTETVYAAHDRGFETRAGGSLSLGLGGSWSLRGGFDWIRHIGYSVSMDSVSGVATDFVYEMTSLEGSLTLAFPVGSYRPVLGVAWAFDRFAPLELYSVTGYENSRLRLILGLELD